MNQGGEILPEAKDDLRNTISHIYTIKLIVNFTFNLKSACRNSLSKLVGGLASVNGRVVRAQSIDRQ
jgi:hypothetical protein